ncbi:SGNH hydrolase-type esterase domain-containing protein [Absidia repens]|uniref:SGNH hydrolase-type esterase domain-containing protein n=1 Tax=Absidia repens TaxID=90262 RepID=A0A1X2IJB1_9FUNG|nr:SGNH hydrolase-type esterase domain-containing protein [Absidia repens]
MNHPYNQVVLFGDSITQMSFDPSLFGFGANLASAYQRKMDVLNRGFSGYNTDWALPIFRQLLPKVEDQHKQAARIELMTIFFGANDAAHLPSFQHVPLDRFKTNLATMIKTVKDPTSPYYNPALRLVLITQPPLNESQWKQRCDENGNPMDRSSEQAQIYAAAVKQIGQEHDTVVVDLWTKVMEMAAENPNGLSDYLFDGLHLNSNGFKVKH